MQMKLFTHTETIFNVVKVLKNVFVKIVINWRNFKFYISKQQLMDVRDLFQ